MHMGLLRGQSMQKAINTLAFYFLHFLYRIVMPFDIYWETEINYTVCICLLSFILNELEDLTLPLSAYQTFNIVK